MKNDGAMVYRRADFDSPVIGYFRQGKQVDLSTKKFGGAFYRVRFKQGVLGYIADSDVDGAKSDKKTAKGASEESEAGAEKEEQSKTRKKFRPPLIQARTYLGPGASYVSYSEIISRVEYKDNMVMGGLMLTFPISTFFVDLSVFGTNQAPSFYKTLSTIPPQGYVVLGALPINFPLFDFGSRRGLVYFGGGPVFAYSSYLIEVSGSKLDVTEARLGGVFNLGFAFDLGGLALKIIPRFYVEKSSYNSVDAVLQFEL